MPSKQDVQQATAMWWLPLVQGIALFVIGWLILAQPVKSTLIIVQILGLYWLISGIVDVIVGLFSIGKKESSWGLTLLRGIIGIMAGAIITAQPILAGILTPIMVTYLLAAAFLVGGIINMVVGNKDREDGKHQWSWGSFFLGLLMVIFALIVFGSPLISTFAFIHFAAFFCIIGGVILAALSFKIRKIAKS